MLNIKETAFLLSAFFFLFGASVSRGETVNPVRENAKLARVQELSEEIGSGAGGLNAYKERAGLLLELGYILSAYEDLLAIEEPLGIDAEVSKMLFDILKECFLSENYAVQYQSFCQKYAPEEVLVYLDQALVGDAENEVLWLEKATFTFHLKLFNTSLASIEKVLSINSNQADYHRHLIIVLSRLKQFSREEIALTEAHRKFPEVSWFYERLLEIYLAKSRFAPANELLRNHINAKKFMDISQYYLGYLFLKENKIKEAVSALKASLEYNPAYTKSKMLLTRVLYLTDQKEEALPYLIHLVNMDIRDITFHDFLASYYIGTDQVYQAEQILLKGLSLLNRYHYQHQKENELLYKLAVIYERIRRTENAERIYLFLLESIPENSYVNGNLGRIYYVKGELEKAERYLIQSLEINKNDRFRQILAEVSLKLGKYEEALKLSKEMLGEQKNVAWNLAFQTLLHNQRGEYLKALGTVNKVRKRNPENLEYANLEILTLVNLRLFDDAETVVDEMLSKNPASYNLKLKLALLKTRRKSKEARELIDDLINSYQSEPATLEMKFALEEKTERQWNMSTAPKVLHEIHAAILNLEFAKAKSLLNESGETLMEDVRLPLLKYFLDSVQYVFLVEKHMQVREFSIAEIDAEIMTQGAQHSNAVFASWMNTLMSIVQREDGKNPEQSLEIALKQNPENLFALSLLADNHRRVENYAIAETLYLKYLEHFPNSPWVKINLALCYDFLKKYAEAENIYLELKEKDPDNAVVLNNLAWLYLVAEDTRFRNLKLALDLSLKATRILPTSHHFDTLAEAFYQHEEYEKALKTIEKALLYDFENLDHFKIQKRKFENALKKP